MEFKKLLSPIKIGNQEIKNRFVVPAMGLGYNNPDGSVSQRNIDYYAERAKGGYGLVIIETTSFSTLGYFPGPQTLSAADDSKIEGLTKLANAIHENGAKTIVQLNHMGRQGTSVAPSAVACPFTKILPRALTTEEVWQLIEDFGDAALRVKKAGFDGVEVHGAHGYIVAEFMSPHANKRFDEFGGDFYGRMKFPLEVFKNIRKKCGDDFILSFRFSADEMVEGGRTIHESPVIARLAEEAGVDVLNISRMTYKSFEWMSPSTAAPSGYNQYDAELIKKAVDIPVIVVGRLGSNMYLNEDILQSGKADFVALGRSSIADPEIPNKVAAGTLDEIAPCISCDQSCLGYAFGGKAPCCLVNPRMGLEGKYNYEEAPIKKNVMVVGSGPAGLEAAWVAAKRGHNVTVYEKENVMGGQYRLAAVPPTKYDILSMLKYYVTMGNKYGVEYKLNTEVDEELVKSVNPDVVILATGGIPLMPPIEGINNPNFMAAVDILNGKVMPGQKVLVAGGGAVGSETADFLGEQNRDVTIIEMNPEIAKDEEYAPKQFLLKRLAAHGIKQITDAKITKFNNNGVEYIQNDEEKKIDGYDTVVLALGARAYNPLESKLIGKVKELYVIGDAVKARRANDATEEALKIASEI